MIRLQEFLARHRRIALDTNVFIYHIEANPDYAGLAGEVFAWLERSAHTAVTSSLTMTELLVQPYRRSNQLLVNQYFGLLSAFPNLEWVAPNLTIADTAARLRARHRLRTPDAIHAATAICCGATALLTNDPDLSRVSAIDVGVLSQLR